MSGLGFTSDLTQIPAVPHFGILARKKNEDPGKSLGTSSRDILDECEYGAGSESNDNCKLNMFARQDL